MKKIYFILMMTIIVFLSSCFALKVNVPISYQAQSIDKMALFPVMIGKIEQPLFPLLDAAAFNGKTNKIADQIMDSQQKTIEKIREQIAEKLQEYFKCNVLYGKSLHNLEPYSNLKEKYHNKTALRIKNDNFPLVIIGSGDVNPFSFSNGNVTAYFKEQKQYEVISQDLCEKLNVDAIAISFSRLSVIDVGMFGSSGRLRLETHIYIVDKHGKTIAKGYAHSKPASIKGRELEDYQRVLDEFPMLFNLLAKQLIN